MVKRGGGRKVEEKGGREGQRTEDRGQRRTRSKDRAVKMLKAAVYSGF